MCERIWTLPALSGVGRSNRVSNAGDRFDWPRGGGVIVGNVLGRYALTSTMGMTACTLSISSL